MNQLMTRVHAIPPARGMPRPVDTLHHPRLQPLPRTRFRIYRENLAEPITRGKVGLDQWECQRKKAGRRGSENWMDPEAG